MLAFQFKNELIFATYKFQKLPYYKDTSCLNFDFIKEIALEGFNLQAITILSNFGARNIIWHNIVIIILK